MRQEDHEFEASLGKILTQKQPTKQLPPPPQQATKKKAILSFAITRRNLEDIILSKISLRKASIT
jgi:hypothetical protein